MSDLEMKALVKFGEEYKQYATVNGQANPSATTHQQMQHLFGNWSDMLERMVANMWQPNTAYELNQVVWTPSMPANMVAICTNAGASGAAEPTWPTLVNNTVTDGAAVWSMVAQVITGESPLGINQGGTGATTASQARKNLGLVSASYEATDYIIETYRNKTEWYEVYKSGKVRQGGAYAQKTSGGSRIRKSITLLKQMADTNYYANAIPYRADVDYGGYDGFYVSPAGRKTQTLEINFSSPNSSQFIDGFVWQVEGQGK